MRECRGRLGWNEVFSYSIPLLCYRLKNTVTSNITGNNKTYEIYQVA